MMVLLTGPLCLLSFYLANLCYKTAYYRHTLFLTIFAIFMLLISLGVVGASYWTWQEQQEKFAAFILAKLPDLFLKATS